MAAILIVWNRQRLNFRFGILADLDLGRGMYVAPPPDGSGSGSGSAASSAGEPRVYEAWKGSNVSAPSPLFLWFWLPRLMLHCGLLWRARVLC